MMTRAFEVADVAHSGQMRDSGEEYISHPLGVAEIVANLGLDEISISAAILHDAVEDTAVTLEQVDEGFGEVVASIVDGLTKLERLSFETKELQKSASMRKMIIAMAKDLRVLIIKLADRLHNMRTLEAKTPEKAQRIAQETLDIYVPLAHRLGMQEIRWQLEDLAFANLLPDVHKQLADKVAAAAPQRKHVLDALKPLITERLAAVGIQVEVNDQPLHLWSIYEKMTAKEQTFEETYGLIGVELVVDSVRDCYAALGAMHSTWKPIQGRFHDYIAMPKFNLYQSLHTTVIGPDGVSIKIQIRTKEMLERAELGIAVHWSQDGGEGNESTPWLQRIVDWQQDTTDPKEFLDSLKLDLKQDEVFVFTPGGRVISFSGGATPIDFAYAVHTEVGHRLVGARVNGRLAPIDSKLSSGDTVEVLVSKIPTAGPSSEWLQVVSTQRARNKIRQWFSKERRDVAIQMGKDDLAKALLQNDLSIKEITQAGIEQLSQSMGFHDLDAFYAAVGEGHLAAQLVVQRFNKSTGRQMERKQPTANGRRQSSEESPLAASFEAEAADTTPIISIEVRSLDRPRLLLDIITALVENDAVIMSSSTRAGADRISRMHIEFKLGPTARLDTILVAIKQVDSVYDAYRTLPPVSSETADA